MLVSFRFKLHICIWRTVRQTILIILLCAFQSTINAQPSLELNTTGQPPLNTQTHDGFMDEVTREALQRIGYKLVINRLPAERGLHSTNDGLIDGEMSRVEGIDQLYTNLIRVPEKIMDWEFYIFSEKTISLQKGWSSLENKSIAFITGWKILEKNVPESATVTKTRNSHQLFTLLKNNRVDYIIYERWGGNRVLNELELKKVKLQKPFLASREMYIYLHNKHKAIVPLLTQALENMKSDGSYERLVQKHLSPLQNYSDS